MKNTANGSQNNTHTPIYIRSVSATKKYVELFFTFFKVGSITFGGGMSMLPIIQRLLVEKKQWLTEEEILDYFAIGQCTPGIIAVNIATFCGYKRAGLYGAVIATLGIVCPSWMIITIIAGFITHFSQIVWITRALKGVYVAVAALLLRSVAISGKKSITDSGSAFIATAAFFGISILNMSGLYIVIAAGVIGYCIKICQKIKIDNRGTKHQKK